MNRLIFYDVPLSQIFKQHDRMLALCLLVFIKERQSLYNIKKEPETWVQTLRLILTSCMITNESF